jgi:hypothetical protein
MESSLESVLDRLEIAVEIVQIQNPGQVLLVVGNLPVPSVLIRMEQDGKAFLAEVAQETLEGGEQGSGFQSRIDDEDMEAVGQVGKVEA